jgi:hypothetical protein
LVSRKNPLSSCSLSSSVKMRKKSFFIGHLWVLQLSYVHLRPEGLSWSLSTSFIYKVV